MAGIKNFLLRRFKQQLKPKYLLVCSLVFVCYFYFNHKLLLDKVGPPRHAGIILQSSGGFPVVPLPPAPKSLNRSSNFSIRGSREKYGKSDDLEKNRTCKIPRIYPFEEPALRMIEDRVSLKGKKPKCLSKSPSRFKTDLKSTLIRLEPDSVFWANVSCCYTSFTTLRTPPNRFKLQFIDTCAPIIGDTALIPQEVENIRVICTSTSNPSEIVYRDYFHFFRLNQAYEEKVQVLEDKTMALGNDQLSILFIGIDTLSATNFQRSLPKTRDYLLNELGAIEFLGLNKVGRGTIENYVPMFTGCSFIDGATVFPSANEECPFIWEKFAQKGYRTALTNEQVWLSAYKATRQDKKGNPGAQYDNLSFILGLQSTGGYVLAEYGCFEHTYSTYHVKDRVLEVARKLSGHLYFHHTWSYMLTHEVIGMAKYLDDPVLEMMQDLNGQDLLNNTIVILGSDHGMISEDYSQTPDGLLEARIPMLVFVFPKWFKMKYSSAMANLDRNSQGLTTPFDVYQTLRVLLDLDSMSNEGLKNRESEEQPGETGLSLFLPISVERTCESAHVPEQYCICRTWAPMNNASTDLSVIRAVAYTLEYMNNVIWNSGKPYTGHCSLLDVKRIIDGKTRKDTQGNTLYDIRFEVSPSDGIFGVVLKVENNKLSQQEIKFSIVGEIERQNKYGNQSSCLDKLGLGEVGWIRSACFCTKYYEVW